MKNAVSDAAYAHIQEKQRKKRADAAWMKFLCQNDIGKILAAQQTNHTSGDSHVKL